MRGKEIHPVTTHQAKRFAHIPASFLQQLIVELGKKSRQSTEYPDLLATGRMCMVPSASVKPFVDTVNSHSNLCKPQFPCATRN